MRPVAAVLLLSLLALAAGASAAEDLSSGADASAPTGAVLIARKFVEPLPPVVGRNATVIVEVFNAGSSAATDVEIKDSTPPVEYFETFGSLEKKIARIAAGATARLEYTVLAASPIQGALDPASVSYTSASSSEGGDEGAQQTTMSAAAVVYVVSLADSLVEKAVKFGSAATLGAVSTPAQWRGVGLSVFLVLAFFFGGTFLRAVRGAGKARSYKRALAEVEKMK